MASTARLTPLLAREFIERALVPRLCLPSTLSPSSSLSSSPSSLSSPASASLASGGRLLSLLLRGPRGVGKSSTLDLLYDALRGRRLAGPVVKIDSLHALLEGRLPHAAVAPESVDVDDADHALLSIAQGDASYGNYDPGKETPQGVDNRNMPRHRHRRKGKSRLNSLASQSERQANGKRDDRACARSEMGRWHVPAYSVSLLASIRKQLDEQNYTLDNLANRGLANALDRAAGGTLEPTYAAATSALVQVLMALGAARDSVLLIDDVDALFRPCVYVNTQSRRLHGTSMVPGHALARAFCGTHASHAWSRVIAAETATPVTALRAVSGVRSAQPRLIPIVWGTGELEYPVSMVDTYPVPHMTNDEIEQYAAGYRSTCVHPDLLLDTGRLRLLSAGNPAKLRAVCRNPDAM